MLTISKNITFLLLRRFLSTHKSFGSNAASTLTEVPEQEEQVLEQSSTKLPPRLPLVKNFFVGLVDNELLAYPEVVQREDMTRLQNELLPLKNFFSRDFDNHSVISNDKFSADLADNLKQLGSYCFNIALDFEGKGWGFSESLMATEPEAQVTEVAVSLLGHRTIVDVIQDMGSAEQKQRYLPKLANGK